MKYILAIDQGTTSSRAILVNEQMAIVGTAQQEFKQYFPASGCVEHDLKDIWSTVVQTLTMVLKQTNVEATEIAAIGITNQRETTVVWDKITGEPIHNAIVWQDRRTADYCAELKKIGFEDEVRNKTGLLVDPYFSGTKIRWILNHVEGAFEKAKNGQLLFGTIDSYLIWKLTGGKKHLTDATNASRTMLYNIRENKWDENICQMLDIPMQMLPEVKNCADDFGETDKQIFGVNIPISGVAGDQQAAAIGQACFKPGMLKSTYGTGCFVLLNTGKDFVVSNNRLLTTIAYRLNGETTYALEGSIFNAGSTVQWLRDGLKMINTASETQNLATMASSDERVYLVPAFTGLGAPYWDAECRGSITGITRNTGRAEIARAALESVAYQTRDLLEAMHDDWGNDDVERILRVDGGMSSSDWTIQFLANILGEQIDRPEILETTAMGAAWLAGMRVGLYPNQSGFAEKWVLESRFEPNMFSETRQKLYDGWKLAVKRTLTFN